MTTPENVMYCIKTKHVILSVSFKHHEYYIDKQEWKGVLNILSDVK